MSAAPERLLVVGPSWVGDMVMAQSLFRTLRARYPELLIDVLAPAWSAPVVARMPEVHTLIEMPVGHGELGLLRRWRLAKRLRQQQYDWSIILPNSLKSALVPWLARIARRTGWRGEYRYGLLNDLRLGQQSLPRMTQRFTALASAPGEFTAADMPPPPALSTEPANLAASAQRFGIDASRPLLVLCPGAEFGGAKCWPPEYYGELAQNYIARGWQVVLLGSKGDVDSCGITAVAAGDACRNLAGHTSLDEAIDLLALASAVVSNDSGLMHVAAALGRPLLALYGPTSPEFTPPVGEQCKVLHSTIECAPCFARECPLGHHDCMRQLQPPRALDALNELVDATQPGIA